MIQHARFVWGLTLILLAVTNRCLAADEPPLVEKYLHSGDLAAGEQALLARLKTNPRDDQARFGLGALQFIQAVEHLGRALHRYGLRSDRGLRMNIPFLRLPIPANQQPEPITYAAARKVLEDLAEDLQKSEQTLAAVKDDKVKLPLRLAEVVLDFAGDGTSQEPLILLLNQYVGLETFQEGNADLLIAFDRGDVAWLRGYCHLLMSLAEIALTYDGSELFDCTAHIFFARPETPHKFLTEGNGGHVFFDLGDGVDVIDVIAFIHLIRIPVHDAKRMTSALQHLEQMIALSRESWKYILVETDDEHEWIPNTKQKGVLRISLNRDMIENWKQFLDEAGDLLSGKRLAPFWRGKEKRGINVRRVFLEPRPLDLVLWLQGTAATPYLEEGPVTDPAVWARFQQVFRGQFLGFALWFN
jgi:hypothetical protein